MDDGCGTVSRVVASETRGPVFESGYRHFYSENWFTVNCKEKTKIKKRRPVTTNFKKKELWLPMLNKVCWIVRPLIPANSLSLEKTLLDTRIPNRAVNTSGVIHLVVNFIQAFCIEIFFIRKYRVCIYFAENENFLI